TENAEPASAMLRRGRRRTHSTWLRAGSINIQCRIGKIIALAFVILTVASVRAERINQEGRILGPAPVVTTPTLFNTPAGDAIVSAMQIFPVTSPWNEDISRRPLLSNSATMISQLTTELSSSRQTLRPFYGTNYALVPDK